MRDRKTILTARLDELKRMILHAANELNDNNIVNKYCSSESGVEIIATIEFYINEMKDIAMELDNE